MGLLLVRFLLASNAPLKAPLRARKACEWRGDRRPQAREHPRAGFPTMAQHPEAQYESLGSTSSSLLRRVRDRDEDAWRRLVRLYGPLVDRWVRQSGLQAADAHDIFQQVFLAVAKGIGQFRRERPGDSFRAWLRTITRTKLADHFRRRVAEPLGAGGSVALRRLAELEAPAEHPPQADEEEGLQQLRLRAMDLIRGEFEPKTWDAFWRVTVRGEPTKNIAADLRVSPAAVRLAKSRVLRRLREELEGLEEL